MAASRKGLVTPQNTFLETVIRRFNTLHTSLIIANAHIVDYPIIYVSESFTRMTNYSAREMMQQGAMCKHMHGPRTSINAIERLQHALDEGVLDQVEITLYKKNRSMLWVVMGIAPVENDTGEILLYLVLIYDISPLRQPMDDDQLRGSFSKFAKLARSVARNRAVHSTQCDFDENMETLAPIQKERIPKYHQEPPRTPPHVLLHYMTFKIVWDWLIFLLTGYTSVIIPFCVAFRQESVWKSNAITAVDRIVDVIFLMDIVLNFHTTFVGPTGAVISDPTLIRLNYLKGWFLVDLIACLPYGLLSFIGSGDKQNVTALFNALKVVRLLRLWRVIRKFDQYMEYVTTILLSMVCCFALLAHWLACVWYMVGMYDIHQQVYHGWIINLLNETERRQNLTPNGDSLATTTTDGVRLPEQSMLYMTSLYFTVSLITSIGFGNVAANTTTEKIASVVFMVISSLVYATIFGNVTTILQQAHAARARVQQLMSSVKDFLRIHSVPKELSERVIDYVTSTWSLTRGVDPNIVLNNCPKDMKADLCVHLYRQVFNEHPAFRLASESCLRALAVAFITQHTAPGDLIFHQGESIDQLCFVISGSLEVIQDDEIVAILSKGDVFGQPVWKESEVAGQSTANVRALTYCDLHCIKRDKLMEVLTFYSAFANSFSRSLVLTYNLRNRLIFRKWSDLEKERELTEMRQNQPALSTLSPDHPVRRLISKFCTNQSNRSSSVSSNEPRIQPISRMGSQEADSTTSESKPKLSRWGKLLNVPKATQPHVMEKQAAEDEVECCLTGREQKNLIKRTEAMLDEQSEFQEKVLKFISNLRSTVRNQITQMERHIEELEAKLDEVTFKIEATGMMKR